MAKNAKKPAKATDEPKQEAIGGAEPVGPEEAVAAVAAPITPSAEEELAETKDKLLRALAEMQNLRNRTERDLEETRKYAITNFALDMIEVLENLYRAEENIPAEEINNSQLFKSLCEGIVITRNSLIKGFEKYGISRSFPKGEKFDHNFHQAMLQIPDAAHEPGTILEVMQAGYVIRGRLLRPALVAIAKTPDEQEAAQ